MWQALLGMFGGAEGVQEASGGAADTPMQKSDKAQAKFEQSSAKRDAMIRQALLSAPTANLSFEGINSQTGTAGVAPAGGVNLGQKSGQDGGMLNFLKGIFTPNESDTAIPEEDESRLEAETQAKARATARATSQVESDPKESVDFYAELQKLFTGPE